MLSRRGFIALGGSGSAAVALAACGAAAEPREGDEDGELLGTAVAAEKAYGGAAKESADQQGVSAEIEKASAARLRELEPAAEDAGSGSIPAEGAPLGTDLPDAASEAIGAYRQLARLGSEPELRGRATQFLAQVAGELAAVNDLNGDKVVPYAFVTGLDEPPLEFPDDAPTETTSSTTTTTTSTSTAADGE